MDKRITKYDSLEAMRAAEYREWHRLPPRERIRAVMDISVATYAMKGRALDVPRLQRTLVRVQRPASPTPEEIRSKGREDWLKLRQQPTEESPAQNDATKGSEKGIDEDLES
jgi:hypothetical protein